MVYKIIVSPNAQKEIENAIDYYTIHSKDAPKYFIHQLKEAYSKLKRNPHFKKRYKNIRSLKIRRFPYSLFFEINEKKKSVKILSCFHNKRKPIYPT